MKRLLSMLFFVAFLCGCTTWVKPGASERDRDADVAACEAIGYDRFAPAVATYLARGSYWEPPSTVCSKSDDKHETCTTSGGGWRPDEYSSHDVNGDARDAFVVDCMYRKGYNKQ
ncbi:hypothetical protein [Dyella acidiphila]|uniref:Lipoprotein n=1 Tax=Dyella acidiphila TaxID=2775866 RepID=A0ABR9G637_9GAMM|nr:hypothetical protein [Dyella acidiphila]MBE1159490.1 hypothetical protein [Dyella acidiphila]